MLEEKQLYGLSRRQRSIIRFIVSFCRDKGYPPSIRDIGTGVGLSSTSTVHAHLGTLEKKGFIRRDPSRPRAMEVITERACVPPAEKDLEHFTRCHDPGKKKQETELIECPLVRDYSDAHLRDWFRMNRNVQRIISLPRIILGSPDAFLFRMINDSMIEAGILEGDFCIFHPADQVKDGEIALIASANQMTIKRVYRHLNLYRLEPENRRMNSVFVRELVMLGCLKGIIRSDFLD